MGKKTTKTLKAKQEVTKVNHKPKRTVKAGIQRVSSRLIQDVVSEAIGEDAMPVVEYLKGRKDISEFVIAKNIKAEVAFVRKILYALQNNNLVTYFRKKDREKGWYISYWTFNPRAVPDVALALRRMRIQKMRERLEKEQEHRGLFYICPGFCSRMEFEKATEVEFRCPECGKPLQHQDNSRTIDRLRENIVEMEQEAIVA